MEFSERFKQSSCKSRNFVFLKKGKHIKSPYKKIIFFAAFCVLTLLLYYSGIGCVWRYFLHIPCPGCGMTRASIMLLKGDFSGALKSHFMFPSVPILFIYIIFDGHIFKYKIIDIAVLSLISFGFILHWLMLLNI